MDLMALILLMAGHVERIPDLTNFNDGETDGDYCKR